MTEISSIADSDTDYTSNGLPEKANEKKTYALAASLLLSTGIGGFFIARKRKIFPFSTMANTTSVNAGTQTEAPEESPDLKITRSSSTSLFDKIGTNFVHATTQTEALRETHQPKKDLSNTFYSLTTHQKRDDSELDLLQTNQKDSFKPTESSFSSSHSSPHPQTHSKDRQSLSRTSSDKSLSVSFNDLPLSFSEEEVNSQKSASPTIELASTPIKNTKDESILPSSPNPFPLENPELVLDSETPNTQKPLLSSTPGSTIENSFQNFARCLEVSPIKSVIGESPTKDSSYLGEQLPPFNERDLLLPDTGEPRQKSHLTLNGQEISEASAAQATATKSSKSKTLYDQLRCNEKDKEYIHKIVTTLGNYGAGKINVLKLTSHTFEFSRYRNYMDSEQEGQSPLHPFKLLETIFTDEDLKKHASNVIKSKLTKGSFLDGISESLQRERRIDNLECHIPAFCEALGVDAGAIKTLIMNCEGKQLFNTLIQKLSPHKG